MALELEFERPILDLEKRLNELKAISEDGKIDLSREINAIAEKIVTMRGEIFRHLEPWQVTQVARHIDRPSTFDYVQRLCGDTFVELHGDRLFGDDPAMVTGFAVIGGIKTAIIGHQKGHDTEQNLHRNFGMPHPEGYRKALRIIKMAERFHRPVVILIDTPGAYPGLGAEERGQSEAIARNLAEFSRVRTPILCFIIGEGGSGGALAIGVGDHVAMFEFAIYSVITAEGCAAILWRDAAKSHEAAQALKIRAQDLLQLGVIDEILPEPVGGVHLDYDCAAESVRQVIARKLPELLKIPVESLVSMRYEKFRRLGRFMQHQDEDYG